MDSISPLQGVRPLIAIALLTLILSGCGGGNGTEDDSAASSDASLAGLTLTGATLDQLFQPSQGAYSASVGFLQARVILKPEATDAGATIQVNGTQIASGNSSVLIELTEGTNLISVTVTAEDGVSTQDYEIVIVRGTVDSLAEQPTLRASNAGTLDGFGRSVAISGDTLVVGAPGEDSSADSGEADDSTSKSGAAYVFTLSDGIWSQQAYLKASNAEAGDEFGYSVSISGDTLVVGAHHEDGSANDGEANNSAENSGAAYVFTRSDGLWSQQAYLKASNAEANDYFGHSVSISGETLVVGAYGEESSASGGEADNSASGAGAAYVFTHSGGAWSQQAYLKASNAEVNDLFGYSVSISSDTLVVGAHYEDSSADGGEANNSAENSGAAYVFTRSDGVWSQQAYLKSSNAEEKDQFGFSVSISGDTLVIGAYGEDSSSNGGEVDNSAANAGAAYVFTRSDGAWNQQTYLKTSNTEDYIHFGRSVAISGDTLAIGSQGIPTTEGFLVRQIGATYVFTRSGGVWGLQTSLIPRNLIWGNDLVVSDYIGGSVAISGDNLVVGSYLSDSSNGGTPEPWDWVINDLEFDSGAVYVWQ
ncbi:MAG: cadherin-like beta sandwich domain-containing protein [Candidatus Thiodiazotropha sp.]